jgi:hypothetical protein
MNDCGPTLWATRSRLCINSATRSLSSKAGAGGVILMFDGTALSLVALTAMAGLSIASDVHNASSAKITRVVFDFLISILLLEYNELASDAEEI